MTQSELQKVVNLFYDDGWWPQRDSSRVYPPLSATTRPYSLRRVSVPPLYAVLLGDVRDRRTFAGGLLAPMSARVPVVRATDAPRSRLRSGR
jgi:hypothetical protein